MTLYALIDTTKLEETRIIALAPLREAQLVGQYHKLQGRNVIGPQLQGKALSQFDLLQLQYLFWNTFQQPPAEDYKELIQNCLKMAGDLPVVDTPIKELERMVERVRPVEVNEASEATPKKKKQSTPKDPTGRPKEGTVTRQVWDMCDELMTKLNRVPERKEAITYCEDPGGIHNATASTQYAKWKKALNEK